MTNSEKCQFILQQTNDGARLSIVNMRIVELAVNGQLNDRGQAALDSLYQEVAAGDYAPAALRTYGQHLTIAANGDVRWRNAIVEHYSFRDRAEEHKSAMGLVGRCLSLEERGLPVISRSVSSFSPFKDAPAGTPWVEAMSSYYTMFEEDEQFVLVLYVPNGSAVALQMVAGQPVVRFADVPLSAFEVFHQLQGEGMVCLGNALNQYASFDALLRGAGITPEAVSYARTHTAATVA